MILLNKIQEKMVFFSETGYKSLITKFVGLKEQRYSVDSRRLRELPFEPQLNANVSTLGLSSSKLPVNIYLSFLPSPLNCAILFTDSATVNKVNTGSDYFLCPQTYTVDEIDLISLLFSQPLHLHLFLSFSFSLSLPLSLSLSLPSLLPISISHLSL